MAARPSDFRLYHSNALDVLAALLAEELRAPAPGAPLLVPDTLLIPQVAMRRWLQATLAARHGIARKSVVEGKSVSVRFDLGGRRLVKKQTPKKTQQQNTH